MKSPVWTKSYEGRRDFIGGSDARIIMGANEAALVRLWREKRGAAEPEDLSGNLIVQLGAATEELNRSWYERRNAFRYAPLSASCAVPRPAGASRVLRRRCGGRSHKRAVQRLGYTDRSADPRLCRPDRPPTRPSRPR